LRKFPFRCASTVQAVNFLFAWVFQPSPLPFGTCFGQLWPYQ
jgi:hypothetical protein